MRVFSVVVTHYGDRQALDALSAALEREGSAVVVVDNTPGVDPGTTRGTTSRCTWIRLGRNTGIAGACNVGIRHALEHDADVIVLFDEDSEVPEGFFAELLRPLCPGTPGVSAPVALEKGTGREYPSRRIGRFGQPKKVLAANGDAGDPVPMDVVITSGCAATAATYRRVGLLDDSLFMDVIDIEWSLRCRAHEVPVVVVPRAVLQHQIGSATKPRLLGLYRGPEHAPYRNYYRVRNSLLLWRCPHAPAVFAMTEVVSVLAHLTVQVLFRSDRASHLRACLLGVWHGLKGVRGARVVDVGA